MYFSILCHKVQDPALQSENRNLILLVAVCFLDFLLCNERKRQNRSWQQVSDAGQRMRKVMTEAM